MLTGAEEAGYAYKYTIHWVKPLTGGLPIKEYKFRFRKVCVFVEWPNRIKFIELI